ncbi:3' terminal RNA ribose 2'-O-methyltransferase Hen1 [Antrihabitans sp. YC2-6]|nr:3' terminal RNA ribose 2'-O-methyltransferase Hen1 [Antrihabitans sp. YC2-6]MBJ8346220.1 3' terminal RNA ribose 2'-O-methyltransferase Hen1 [Antrihabitans sp. YC2-6]
MLTISTTANPATDLGYLLHKHPDRVQDFGQSFGIARVVYPEADETRCTAALLLDVDSVQLARTRDRSAPDYALGQYVNDRPYAASSLLAVAIGSVFRTARTGKCDNRPQLAAARIPLEITLPALPCRGGPDLARRLFEPMGWAVDTATITLDETFPEWGDSRYLRLTLRGDIRLADALNHLYVLLPVLDDAKHYWVASDEVDKLIRAGASWLAEHPEKELITRRFLRHRSVLTRAAFERLAELGDDLETALDPAVDEEPTRVPLNALRREAVVGALDEIGAATVIDLGCGSGQLISALLDRPAITKVAGVDVSARALTLAGRRVKERAELFQGSLTYTDDRFRGYDAAVLMEVIEHIDPPRLAALEQVVFGRATPQHVIVTTPNCEYNIRYEGLDGMRHTDHRFEWDRAEFQQWATRVGERYGYCLDIRAVGDNDPDLGSPTQMAVFTKRGADV